MNTLKGHVTPNYVFNWCSCFKWYEHPVRIRWHLTRMKNYENTICELKIWDIKRAYNTLGVITMVPRYYFTNIGQFWVPIVIFFAKKKTIKRKIVFLSKKSRTIIWGSYVLCLNIRNVQNRIRFNKNIVTDKEIMINLKPI